ncbi:UBP-type zinc finger domain-containing protein [Gordonia sp. SL306]|uniref:UBP-type zinc finger domain-containing protein n=1 Tax=Gordonia sp. SL306 TaxID=2995145 RepID=UPI0022701A17|nr:UBP-type zinc finger domain-containing protein [Gordonia sp. SL306]WAC57037.1 UBP-type zinc finger domain-containing protein [Gordonia sp. SL306]
MTSASIDPDVPPSGPGCVECTSDGSWWVHLRRCAQCGHVGCCDDSLHRHARRHAEATGHRVIQSYEPGEEWFWDFTTEELFAGPALAAPNEHPASQGVPGPRERLPEDWRAQLGSRDS